MSSPNILAASVACRRLLFLIGAALSGCATAPLRGDASNYNWYKDWAPVPNPDALSNSLSNDPLDTEIKRSADAGSRECATIGTTWEEALQCVYSARAAHLGATVTLRNIGVDSMLGWGIVSRVDGSIDLYRYDSSPCGGGNCNYALRTAKCKQVAEPPDTGTLPKRICLSPLF